jgi:hypothetical protein
MKEVVSEDVVMPTTAAQALHGKLNCIIKGDVTGLATAPSEGEERGESISDAFRLNALPLRPGLSKLEPIPLPSSFHPVTSPPEVTFQLVPDVVCQLVLRREEEEPAQIKL